MVSIFFLLFLSITTSHGMEQQKSYDRSVQTEIDWKSFCNWSGSYYAYLETLNVSTNKLEIETLNVMIKNAQEVIEKLIPDPNAIENYTTSNPSMCMTEFHEQPLLVKALREKDLWPALYLLEHGAKKIKHRANRKKILGNDANGYLREQYRNLRKLMKEIKEASN